jgi:hypothetical protein
MLDQKSLRIFTLLLGTIAGLSLALNVQITWSRRSLMAKAYYDFVIYYTGAEIVNAGRGKDLYDLNVQQAYQERFKFPDQPWPVLPFNHAPYELLPFMHWQSYLFTQHILFGPSSASSSCCPPAPSYYRDYTQAQNTVWRVSVVLLSDSDGDKNGPGFSNVTTGVDRGLCEFEVPASRRRR